MEYQIRFTIPDELDPLVDLSERRKKYLIGKITEFVQGLMAQEMMNHVEHGLTPHSLETDITRQPISPARADRDTRLED